MFCFDFAYYFSPPALIKKNSEFSQKNCMLQKTLTSLNLCNSA